MPRLLVGANVWGPACPPGSADESDRQAQLYSAAASVVGTPAGAEKGLWP